MALRQQQELKQIQKLSPLQMQVIKLVELNTVELEDKIKQELEENPALEAGDEEMPQDPDDSDITLDNEDESENVSQEDIILGDYASEEDIPDYRINGTPDYDPYYRQTNYSDEKSLIESLEEQIALHSFIERILSLLDSIYKPFCRIYLLLYKKHGLLVVGRHAIFILIVALQHLSKIATDIE